MHESEKWKWSLSVVSDSLRPHGLQPPRLPRPWDFPGKSTGVGCHCLLPLCEYLCSNFPFFYGHHIRLASTIMTSSQLTAFVMTSSPKKVTFRSTESYDSTYLSGGHTLTYNRYNLCKHLQTTFAVWCFPNELLNLWGLHCLFKRLCGEDILKCHRQGIMTVLAHEFLCFLAPPPSERETILFIEQLVIFLRENKYYY